MATNIIDKVLRIDAEFLPERNPEAELKLDNVLIECGFEVGGGGRLPYYQGEYEITPKAYDETVLNTKNKSLKDDVKVLEIPFSKVSNPQGGYTITIGE